MKHITIITILLAILFSAPVATAQVPGDPNHSGRLEFVYTSMKYTAMVDGAVLEATDGMKATVELSHGNHLIQIHQMTGLFKTEVVFDGHINIPGGYIVRARYKDDIVDIFETVPIPGLNVPTPQPVQPMDQTATKTVTTTTTTKMGGAPGQETVGMKVGMGGEEMSISVSMPGMGMGTSSSMEVVEQTTTTTTVSEAKPVPVAVQPLRNSKITIMSEEGMCEVYLDGKRKLELPLSGIDEMATATIYDVSPGNYLIKIEGFEIWHEGKLRVGSGENIKIRTEPGRFEVIGRDPLP